MRKYRNLTDRQNELMEVAKGGLKRINILHGSVRSGKTWISLVLWCIWIRNMPSDKAYIMTAKTLTTLKRNCLDLLEVLAGRKNFRYSLSKKEGELFGRKIYLEGVNDAGAESKIRGMTLQGAYCDEVTLFNEEFFNMLLSRLSEPEAKLFGTTNPDNPNHWFKVNYIDRRDELNFFMMEFSFDDTPIHGKVRVVIASVGGDVLDQLHARRDGDRGVLALDLCFQTCLVVPEIIDVQLIDQPLESEDMPVLFDGDRIGLLMLQKFRIFSRRNILFIFTSGHIRQALLVGVDIGHL